MQGTTGRANQKLRTRNDLLKAAAALLKEGRTPSLDDVAEAALVSRATAYRYFPSIEALLAEAALDVATPDIATIFGPEASGDPVARLEKVDTALHDMVLANEPALRLMLASALQRAARGEGASDTPLRQNRRTPLIEAALEPARRQLRPGSIEVLAKALALVIGTEAMVVLKDVLRVDDEEARKIKKWAIRAMVDAARR